MSHNHIHFKDGLISSFLFEDSYFFHHGGFAESQYVFIEGNTLPQRFAAPSTSFTIGELGFGTGLNFFTTLLAWQAIAPRPPLTFISFERFPLEATTMREALSQWPDVHELQAEFLTHYQPEAPQQTLTIASTTLQLYHGDAREQLPQHIQPNSIDAWFLDGFNPKTNPELWEETLLTHVAHTTKQGGTFATYTSAGFVKRNLQAAGFTVTKQKGFAYKKEMLVGEKA